MCGWFFLFVFNFSVAVAVTTTTIMFLVFVFFSRISFGCLLSCVLLIIFSHLFSSLATLELIGHSSGECFTRIRTCSWQTILHTHTHYDRPKEHYSQFPYLFSGEFSNFLARCCFIQSTVEIIMARCPSPKKTNVGRRWQVEYICCYIYVTGHTIQNEIDRNELFILIDRFVVSLFFAIHFVAHKWRMRVGAMAANRCVTIARFRNNFFFYKFCHLPEDCRSIYLQIGGNSVTFVVIAVLYHGTADTNPTVLDTCDKRLSVIHRLVTPAMRTKRKWKIM